MYTRNHTHICKHIRTHACKHKHKHAHRHTSTDRHTHTDIDIDTGADTVTDTGHRHTVSPVYTKMSVSACVLVEFVDTSHRTPLGVAEHGRRARQKKLKTKAIYLLSTACYFTYLLWIHPMMSYVTRVNDSCHTYE